MLSPRFASYTYEVTVEVYHQCKRIKSAVDTHMMVVVQSFSVAAGVRCASVLSTTARSAISVSFDYHNVYVDTLALRHIIWQDIKDQMARLAVASRVKQPQKSTLIVQRPLRH